MTPPGKWQVRQRASRIGFTWVANSIFPVVAADVLVAGLFMPEWDAAGPVTGVTTLDSESPHMLELEASVRTRIKMLPRMA